MYRMDRVLLLVLALLFLCACQPVSPDTTGAPLAATEIAWPGPRTYHAMAVDEESQQLILLGGQLGGMVPLDDTWAYSVAEGTWQQMRPEIRPPHSEGPMAYDPKRDRIYYLAALDSSDFSPLTELWRYDYNSNTWEQLNPTGALPDGLVGSRMVYDSESDRMILFGGYDIPNDTFLDQTWAYDADTDSWTRMNPDVVPPGINFNSVVYDSRDDRVLMWGGFLDDRMWSYDYNADAWSEVDDSGTPPMLDYTRMIYLPDLHQSILFGGVDVPDEVPQAGTWLYDHTTRAWRQLPLTNLPDARAFHNMVFDSHGGRILLYGGGIDRTRAVGDLWAFDPATLTWSEVTPADASHMAVAPAVVNFMLTGADKRSSAEGDPVAVHELPGMDETLVASLTYKDRAALDLYVPSDRGGGAPLPAVVLAHGMGAPASERSGKDSGPSVSWAQLVAASEMAAVTYDAADPEADLADVLTYITTNAAILGIDPQRLCLWSSSEQMTAQISAATHSDAPYHGGLRCAVALYGSADPVDGTFPADFSLLAVRAGQNDPEANARLEAVCEWAEAEGVDVTMVELVDGGHGFDLAADVPQARAVIEQLLTFMQEKLTATP